MMTCGVEQMAARQVHNLEVAGSSPAPATTGRSAHRVGVHAKASAGRRAEQVIAGGHRLSFSPAGSRLADSVLSLRRSGPAPRLAPRAYGGGAEIFPTSGSWRGAPLDTDSARQAHSVFRRMGPGGWSSRMGRAASEVDCELSEPGPVASAPGPTVGATPECAFADEMSMRAFTCLRRHWELCRACNPDSKPPGDS